MRSKSFVGSVLVSVALVGCGTQESGGTTGTGGHSASGGSTGSGGSASGGSTGSGGSASGGSTGSGGSASGGSTGSGGSASGGSTGSGGSASGGSTGSGGSAGAGGGGAGRNGTGSGGSAAGGAPGSAGALGTAGRTGAGGAGPQGGASGGAGRGGATGGNGGSGGPTFHVFLLLGQSNMAGYPKAATADKVKNERIRVLGFDDCSATGRKADQWDVAVPPLHECFAGAIGPGDYFSKTLIDKVPAGDTIGLVPGALSGKAIAVFSKGAEKYDWIIKRAKNAQQMGGVIEGLLFHQGESDCGSSTWPMKVKQLVSDLKADLKLGDVPFLVGELPYDSACKNHNPLVNMLPGMIPNTTVISAQGLALDASDTSNFHFGHDAQVEFGKRYEAAFLKAVGW